MLGSTGLLISVSSRAQDPFSDPFGTAIDLYPQSQATPHPIAVLPTVTVDERPVADASIHLSVREALEWRVSMQFSRTPLIHVVRTIEQAIRFDTLVSYRALDEAGVGTDTPISFKVHNTRLKDALTLMLQEAEITWTIRNGKLLITSRDDAEEHLETRIYPVRDLVLSNDGGELFDDYEALIDLIEQSIAVDSWTNAGGNGSIEPFPNGKALVISQTLETQEQIVGLLASLRKAKQQQGLGAVSNVGSSYLVIGDRDSPATEQPFTSFERTYSIRQPATWQIPRTH